VNIDHEVGLADELLWGSLRNRPARAGDVFDLTVSPFGDRV
jgi:hypothetical protein